MVPKTRRQFMGNLSAIRGGASEVTNYYAAPDGNLLTLPPPPPPPPPSELELVPEPSTESMPKGKSGGNFNKKARLSLMCTGALFQALAALAPRPPTTTSGVVLSEPEGPMTREEEVVHSVWTRHRRWSLAADRQRARIKFYQNLHLGCMVTGAFFQTLAVRYHTSQFGWLVALLGGGCLGAAPLISNTHLSKESKEDWIRCRAISKQIKAQVFQFQAGVPPYDVGNPAQALVNRVAEISEAAKDLRVFFVMTQADGKKPPPKLDRTGYMEQRVNTQMEGFYEHARNKAKISSRLKGWQAALAAGSALIGIVSGSAGGAVASVSHGKGSQAVFSKVSRSTGLWGVTLATAASAFGSHVASGKYDDQVVERSSAGQRLENLKLRLPKSVQAGSPEWTTFVLQCEEVIASNSKMWADLLTSSDDNLQTRPDDNMEQEQFE